MAVEIVMPRLSDSMEEGTILQWFVAEGDQVAEGEPLLEVETDKASVTYESEHDGVLLAVNAQTGDSVAVGAVIAVIGEAGESETSPSAEAVAVTSGSAGAHGRPRQGVAAGATDRGEAGRRSRHARRFWPAGPGDPGRCGALGRRRDRSGGQRR